jgi:hypothetical protein
VQIDLDAVPLSLPGSRLLVTWDDGGMVIQSAEYERVRSETVLLQDVQLTDADGTPLPIDHVEPGIIGCGPAGLAFAGRRAMSIGAVDAATRWRLRAVVPHRPGVSVDVAPDGVTVRTDLVGAPTVHLTGVRIGRRDSRGTALESAGAGPVLLTHGDPAPAGPLGHGAHLRHRAETRAAWDAWMSRCPRVRADLAPMARLCWYVLGANTIDLGPEGTRGQGVVPALRGYAGVWQWDAYFIASGLRHGAPELAAGQLDLVLGSPSPNGQLPDVVHDSGVLARSDDLPPGDQENLRRLGSPVADPSIPVPLTKPPLAAWAVQRLADGPHPVEHAWVDEQMERVLASQRWWFAEQDSDGDGLPEYSHPYSSGLDDSPIFDTQVPLASPDLAAYLVLQDDLLARWARTTGRSRIAAECAARANRTLRSLLDMWDGARFRARGPHGVVVAEAVTELLPVLTGRLPHSVLDGVLRRLDEHFATPVGVPTVAVDDAAFDPDRMWRGPSWVNVDALLVHGLRASGEADRARALAERTLAMVIGAGGPFEYVNPLTGQPGPRAVSAFSWSAALFVDLAVEVTGDPRAAHLGGGVGRGGAGRYRRRKW